MTHLRIRANRAPIIGLSVRKIAENCKLWSARFASGFQCSLIETTPVGSPFSTVQTNCLKLDPNCQLILRQNPARFTVRFSHFATCDLIPRQLNNAKKIPPDAPIDLSRSLEGSYNKNLPIHVIHFMQVVHKVAPTSGSRWPAGQTGTELPKIWQLSAPARMPLPANSLLQNTLRLSLSAGFR